MRARWLWRQAVPVSGQTMASTSLRDVHERLVQLGSEPVFDADPAWQDLRRKLPDRPLSWSSRLMAWLRRPAIAIMTTGLLSTGVAHAAGVQPVRRGVEWLLGGVTSIAGARNEPRLERETRPRQGQSGLRDRVGSWEENHRRLLGGAGVEGDQEREPAGGGRGPAPAPGGAGSAGEEDRAGPRDDDRDEREREDDDGDEREDLDDSDDEGRSAPDDDEAEETDDEDLEESDDPVDRESDDDLGDLDSESHEEAEPEGDRDQALSSP